MGNSRQPNGSGGTSTATEFDPVALGNLEGKIAERARVGDLITYSELFSGVEFVMPTTWPGRPHLFDVHEWTQQERTIATDYLRMICERSQQRFGFMATAIVVRKGTLRPSETFFELAEEMKLLRRGSREGAQTRFWADQVKKVHEHYAKS